MAQVNAPSRRKKSESSKKYVICVEVRKVYRLPSLLVLSHSIRPFRCLLILF